MVGDYYDFPIRDQIPHPQASSGHVELNRSSTKETLLPFPIGWYSVGFDHEILPGQCVGREFMGQKIVVFRTVSGRLHVVDAYCPHLGADMGDGGTVEGETLRCPFHGFTFDGVGRCTGTPYSGKRTPTIRLGIWPVRQVDGAIMVYYDPDHRSPAWNLTSLTQDGQWRGLRTKTWRFRGHPQETSENAVDWGHLTTVHRFTSMKATERPRFDGPLLTVTWALEPSLVSWLHRLLSKRHVRVEARARITLYGLGYSVVETTVLPFDAHYRQVVMATPVDGEFIDLRVSVSLRRFSSQRRPPLRRMNSLGEQIVERYLAGQVFREVESDIAIWRKKSYRRRPQLAQGDGPIGQYRVWTRQFYR